MKERNPAGATAGLRKLANILAGYFNFRYGLACIRLQVPPSALGARSEETLVLAGMGIVMATSNAALGPPFVAVIA